MAFSVSDVIAQNTVGYSEGLPVGVPASYTWYNGMYKPAGNNAPPSGFTSVTGWGQVYQQAGTPAYSNPNATVEVANARTYVHLKATGEWVLVQDQADNRIVGGHFVSDFKGNAGSAMKVNVLPNGSTSFSAPPAGYNDHFWSTSRGVFAAGSVDAVYVQMDMRVNDPNLHLVGNIGADWWKNPSVGYVDGFSNNPGAGMSNWVALSTEWSTLGFYSSTTEKFLGDLPPPLDGLASGVKPTITSFTDTGTAGDGITNAAVLTLAGSAAAGSTVNVFDGANQLGSTKANAAGSWSFTTAQLSNVTHSLTAKTTDSAGKTQVSAALSVTVDTVAPSAPKITSFTPDTGVAGDGITDANRLTLAGTAEANSVVKVFDGATEIGTSKASASGAWSFMTVQLSNATHSFTAKASDVAGNTSSASVPLSVKVDTTSSASDITGQNLLVNGSFESSPVLAGRWKGFSSIPGWTALTGGTIELWNNLNNVQATDGTNFGELDFLGALDGMYQTVKTEAGRSYDLSFDARSRPGFTGSTTSMVILWNDSVVAVVPPGSTWNTYRFSVSGTGGQDKLTVREADGQGADGLGALYDNFSLVAVGSGSTAQTSSIVSQSSSITQAVQAMDLVTQYSAASFATTGPVVTNGYLSQSDASSTLPTLAKSQH